MLVYPHPLDYATGIKYSVVDKSLGVEYTVSPDSFIVEEIVDFEKTGFNNERGEYAVLRVLKVNTETFKALELVSSKLGIPVGNIIFFGIKDKNATTKSYFFIKSQLLDPSLLPIETRGVKIELVGFTKKKPSRSIFQGNKFTVIIETGRVEVVKTLREIVDIISTTGIPSYYGYQRFGVKRCNSHLLGKLLLLKREDLFADVLLRTIHLLEDPDVSLRRLLGVYRGLIYEEHYISSKLGMGMTSLAKKTHNILVDAYASYLFNLLLNKIIETSGLNRLATSLPMPGCLNATDYYSDIFYLESLKPSVIKLLPCFHRPGLFKPRNNVVYTRGDSIIYEFELEPGMYASIVLRELFKDKLYFEGK